MPHPAELLETNGFNQLAKVENGYCLYNKNDIYVGQSIAKYGEFSKLELFLLTQLCKLGDTVIDVGANIGAHTMGLARQVGESGCVLAFEPQRIVFQALCANIALNSLENVTCYWAAMGTEKGFITVPEIDPTCSNNFGGVSISDGVTGIEVPCFILDQFVGVPYISLIKIDVEGMEIDVIKGGQELIKQARPFLYVENDRLEKSTELMQTIAELNYDMYWHTPLLYNSENFYREQENNYPGIASFNMLCVPKENPLVVEGLTKIEDFLYHPLRRL
ncbi:MAG: FkbM family methyltransferase [Pseudomonadota bacterium]